MQDDDADIMELINGQGENDELLKQLQGEMEDGGDDQYYFEHQDGEGNVYLMDPHEDVLPEDNADFANMVQQDEGEHNSTIINSSQNTSLEEGFKQMHE